MVRPIRAVLVVIAWMWLAACGGGSDNSNMTQTGAPPGNSPPPGSSPQPGSNSPPGSNTPPGSGGSPGAITAAQPGRFNAAVTAMTYVPDGNGDVYVGGNFTSYNGKPVGKVVRLKPDGTLDDRFHVTSMAGGSVTALAVADNGSGDLYVSEEFVNEVSSLTDRGQISKVHPNGEPDASFAIGHITSPSDGPIPPPIFITAMTTAGNGMGQIYVGGVFDQYNTIPVSDLVRVNSDGTLDRSFAPDPSGVYRMVLANDGSRDLYTLDFGQIGPSRFGSKSVKRFNPDGTPDAAFARPGIGGDNFTRIRAIANVDDGSGDLFVAGSFTFFTGYDGPAPTSFVRINGDGTLDEASPHPQASGASLLTKTTDGSGDWIVLFGSPLQRYKMDGPPDPAFMPGEITGVGVNAVLPTLDGTGDLYVGGDFTAYNGVAAGHIVRIHSNGTLVAASSP